MSDTSRRRSPVSRSLDQWRRYWIAVAQDAYVHAWQTAWAEGCSAGWSGAPLRSCAYRSDPENEAWTAGWNWAQIQPDRRHRTRADAYGAEIRRSRAERRRYLSRAAKTGVLSILVAAAARWLLRGRVPYPVPGSSRGQQRLPS